MIAIALLGLVQAISPLRMVSDSIRMAQDVLHYDVNLAVPERGDVVRAVVSLRYLVQGDRGPLRLDFDDRLTIDSIVFGGRAGLQSEDWWWGLGFPESGTLEVDQWGSPGDTLSVTVYYHGRPSDGLVFRDNIHGERTVFGDNWPNRAHFWLPSEDHPSDKATVSFAVEVPRGWRVVANGRLRGVDSLHDGRSIWRWHEGRPIPAHTMVIGAGVMSVSSLGEVDGVPQSVWTFPEDSAFAVEGPFRRARQMVAIFRDVIGPYPYEKLAHVQSSTRFGGMENSSAIFYNERAYASGSLREGTVAHEIAHQWFGDAVAQHDWHHLWLSEGFATYFGSLFFQLVGEGEKFAAAMRAGKRQYMSSPMVESPVIDTAMHNLFDLLNTNNYQKGAWVLHMLRAELGDSLFLEGIREYYETYRDSTALTGDFAAIVAKYAGRSMDWFFEQWLLRPGFPRLQVAWRHDGAAGRLIIDVKQVQPRDWGEFTFSLPVLLQYQGGITRPEVLLVEGRDTKHEIKAAVAPNELVLDPAETLLIEVVRVARGS
jgi:aminopeptidase N